MSFYYLCRALFELNDPHRRAAYRADRERFIDGLEALTDDERRILREVDLARMHERGVPIYLIRTLALVHEIGFEEVGVATSGRSRGSDVQPAGAEKA